MRPCKLAQEDIPPTAVGGPIEAFRIAFVGEGELGIPPTAVAESKAESKAESEAPVGLPTRVLTVLRGGPLPKARVAEAAEAVGKRRVDGQLNAVVRDMLRQGLIEYTLPDKPTSRLQRYQLTESGQEALPEHGAGATNTTTSDDR